MHDTYPLSDKPRVSGLPVNAFPTQDLWSFNEAQRRKRTRDAGAPWRRAVIFGGAALLTAYLTHEFYQVLAVGGIAQLEIVLITFFVLNIAWLALSFMTATAGFAVVATRRAQSIIDFDSLDPAKPLASKTAILLCTYNEAPERIFGTALATMRSLAEGRHASSFDVFIISDTTDPDIWVQEEAAYQAALAKGVSAPALFYRRRSSNIGKKAGNIADWCRRWGHAYENMLVLDSDSLMEGETIEKLALAMDAYPEMGLIQTVPVTMGRNTLFARLQQFANRVYGPIHAAGLAFWHRGTGNFWGHNAIIRTRAFIENAGLPELPGKPPFGGTILSHDFVEAALLVRAGWRVTMVPELKGSYEESPPSLIDFAMRDRRWCQGNLQHSRLLGVKGLHWLSRVHLVMGIMAYVSVLLWFLFLVSALSVTIQAEYTVPDYFRGAGLFPTWPMQDSARAMTLLFWTLTLLLLPKIYGYLIAVFSSARRGFGGVSGLSFSVLLETLMSSLFAHILMALQSSAIIEVLLGRDSGWKPQNREDGSMSSLVVMRYHLTHMALGLGLAALTYLTSLALFLWMLPASVGLTLAGPLSALSAKRSWGEGARALNLLRIPEETSPPPIARLARQEQDALAADVSRREAIASLAGNPTLRRLHKELILIQPVPLEARFSPNLAIARAKLEVSGSLSELLGLLKPAEKAALLSDPESLARLEALIPIDLPRQPAAPA
ncbi:MAG: glucans biosynthesis glucosyltransferase MdoH [Hyphomicrobiales bacterium]|nr:glucans biosynthesis glucosyltransferase MdoH [Hyphomicrobiales bacterium]